MIWLLIRVTLGEGVVDKGHSPGEMQEDRNGI